MEIKDIMDELVSIIEEYKFTLLGCIAGGLLLQFPGIIILGIVGFMLDKHLS